MSLADDLASQAAQSVRAERPTHPQGWEPGIAWNGQTGTITSRPIAEPGPDWAELLRVWGFDPDKVEVVEPVQVRTWDAAIGNGETRTMWYYRAGIRQRREGAPDVGDHIRSLRRKRPAPRQLGPTGESTFGVVLADWQLGREFTDATVQRWGDGYADVRKRYRDLRKIGRRLGSAHILSVGDLVEGCRGWYPNQAFTVELNKRKQVSLGRHMVVGGVEEWAPDFDAMLVTGVGGNHGEARTGAGEADTDASDNADIEIIEQAGEVIRAAPAFGHVRFALPAHPLTTTLDVMGTIVGLTHGHMAKVSGSTPQAKMRRWLEGQAYGRQLVGDSDVIINGHWHHWSWIRDSRHILQAPPLASGSRYFADVRGNEEIPGILTFVIGPNGLRDVEIL